MTGTSGPAGRIASEEAVTFMDDGPLPEWGLRSVTLADQAIIEPYLKSLSEPLSDYTFAQLFTWRNSLRILWKEIEGHLCIFANGSGDLTLLMPPIGDGGSDRALRQAFELMDAHNVAVGLPRNSRVEYVSDEMLQRFDASGIVVEPLATDYIYQTDRMIDLAGGDLASKRQAKNRFMRNYAFRTEVYDPSIHLDACLDLLNLWKHHQDEHHADQASCSAQKRQKESTACTLALREAPVLGLRGMVVHVQNRPQADGTLPVPELPADAWSIRGFTLGQHLGSNQSSIVIEKTDLQIKGLAQYIFSEFCRTQWADRPLVNVGDDWGLETLAWTKMSYRPVKLLQKHIIRMPAKVKVAIPPPPQEPVVVRPVEVRRARKQDIPAAVALEQTCFDAYQLTKRQLQYFLQHQKTAILLVAEQEGRVVGEGVALMRHHKRGTSGRIYSLAVNPNVRGQKIGMRIIQRMIEELTAGGVGRIYLEVEQTNSVAIHIYEQLGFRCIGRMPDYYGPGRNALHMMHLVAQPAIGSSPSSTATGTAPAGEPMLQQQKIVAVA